MYVYMHVYHIQSLFCSFQLPHSTPGLYSCKVGTTKSQTLIDGGGTAVGGATGTSLQKFFAGHSGVSELTVSRFFVLLAYRVFLLS